MFKRSLFNVATLKFLTPKMLSPSVSISLGAAILLSLMTTVLYADTDGMDDAWEVLYGLDPNDNADAALDLDGDGLSNLDEFLNDTFPNDKDSDDDGINDKTEVFYGYDPRSNSSTPIVSHASEYNYVGNSRSFGASVSRAGFIDDDDVPDFIIGEWQGRTSAATPVSTGLAHVYSGADGSLIGTIEGAAQNDNFGIAVSSIDDLNNDGRSELLIGAIGDDTSVADAGSVRIVSGIDFSTLTTIYGNASTDSFGGAVAAAGDVNNDNIPDIIIGATSFDTVPATGSFEGEIAVYSGSSAQGYALIQSNQGSTAFNQFGQSVSAFGDFDGDGFDDYLGGAGGNPFRVILYSGQTGSQLFRIDSRQSSSANGYSMGSLSDVTGEGEPEFVVGAFLYNAAVGDDAGAVFIYSSDRTRIDVFGDAAGDKLGVSVAGIGDVNGDGFADVIAGASGDNYARVFSGVDGSTILTVRGDQSEHKFGEVVSGLGDLNKDGIEDFIVASSGSLLNGETRVYFSSATPAGPADTTPDGFTFVAVNDVGSSALTESNLITVTGINDAATISISNGGMSINGGAYITTSTTVSLGNTVRVRGLSSSISNEMQTVTLNIGGVTGQFNITTGDVIAPVITAPANITLSTSLANLDVNILTNGSATATDDVDANPVINHDQISDTVNFNAPGVYEIIWTATDSEGNSSSATQTLIINSRALEADLSVALNADVNSAIEGDNITYSININNNGIDTANNVSATFVLPGNTTWVSNSAGCNENTGTVTCSQATLNNGSQTSFSIVVLTTQGETLNASVNISADEVDPNTNNNSANNSIDVVAAVANLVTELSRTGSTIIDVNETVTSTLKITNNGNAVAANVSVNVRIQSYSNPDLQFTDINLAQCSANGQDILGSRVFDVYRCDLGDINPAQNVELVISATAPAESSEFIATMNITATSLSAIEENISIRSAGTVEVDEGGGGSGSINSLLLFLLALPLFIRRRIAAAA